MTLSMQEAKTRRTHVQRKKTENYTRKMFAYLILKKVQLCGQEKNTCGCFFVAMSQICFCSFAYVEKLLAGGALLMLSLFSSYTFRFGFLTISSVIIALGSYGAQAADKNASKQPTQAEQAELEKFDSYSGPINILEPNANSEIHKFLENNDGKTVYLDTTIVRYIPIDPTYIDDPNIRASTDRFENPVFTKCWPDQRADYEGILNFGEEGFPLPKDDKDIEGGCASRIRFNLPNIKDVASIPTVWGDNKAQVFVNGFFSVAKSASGNGKTLYTLTPEKDVPNETKVIFDNHKSTQHPEAQLAFEKGKPELAK